MHKVSETSTEFTFSERSKQTKKLLENKTMAIVLYTGNAPLQEKPKTSGSVFLKKNAIAVIFAAVICSILVMLPMMTGYMHHGDSALSQQEDAESIAKADKKPEANTDNANSENKTSTKETDTKRTESATTAKASSSTTAKTTSASESKDKDNSAANGKEPQKNDNDNANDDNENKEALDTEKKEETPEEPVEGNETEKPIDLNEVNDFALNVLGLYKNSNGEYVYWELNGALRTMSPEDVAIQKQLMEEAAELGSQVKVDDINWTSYSVQTFDAGSIKEIKCLVPGNWGLKDGSFILVYCNNRCVKCPVENSDRLAISEGVWRSLGFISQARCGDRHMAIKKSVD